MSCRNIYTLEDTESEAKLIIEMTGTDKVISFVDPSGNIARFNFGPSSKFSNRFVDRVTSAFKEMQETKLMQSDASL